MPQACTTWKWVGARYSSHDYLKMASDNGSVNWLQILQALTNQTRNPVPLVTGTNISNSVIAPVENQGLQTHCTSTRHSTAISGPPTTRPTISGPSSGPAQPVRPTVPPSKVSTQHDV